MSEYAEKVLNLAEAAYWVDQLGCTEPYKNRHLVVQMLLEKIKKLIEIDK